MRSRGQDHNDELIYRYLLGRCSKPEQLALESAYLRDNRLFNRLVDMETAVVAAYERGELSTDDRAAIERHLLKHRHKPRTK